ncbi:hypothetical protein PVAP13_8NG303684 [Panicum virgatum]|uniref:Uncharacterized protein n=1 Tax=Panicum virgatum TaxID=38727 RepID=A0A8T0PGB1_PANVG|nr:hypothetical protein PVAP13_8NG303684 [Panicum virgatum]
MSSPLSCRRPYLLPTVLSGPALSPSARCVAASLLPPSLAPRCSGEQRRGEGWRQRTGQGSHGCGTAAVEAAGASSDCGGRREERLRRAAQGAAVAAGARNSGGGCVRRKEWTRRPARAVAAASGTRSDGDGGRREEQLWWPAREWRCR